MLVIILTCYSSNLIYISHGLVNNIHVIGNFMVFVAQNNIFYGLFGFEMDGNIYIYI